MSRSELRQQVLEANLALPAHGLASLTWGNASGVDRADGIVAIKPSGVPYERMRAEDIVLIDLDGGNVVDGGRPSTDTPSHLELYRAFEQIGGIVHTHSRWATAWAQAGRPIPLLGTTHADLSAHPIPVTRELTPAEVADDYERATGLALIEAISENGPVEMPCALARGHAPFCWGPNAAKAVECAVTLEEVARLTLLTTLLEPDPPPLADAVRRKHFERKHGPSAYYGQ
jgi:L-ribulose-5-phosphate 4-epimerase